MKEFKDYLDERVQDSLSAFNREISTDENKDYRRGFHAGVLFSYLHTRSSLWDMINAPTEK